MKNAKKWWLLTTTGVLITLLGVWVYQKPVENYIALSVLFSVIIFTSGIFEILFAVSNRTFTKGWGWTFFVGIFDLIIGLILMSQEHITMAILPIIFGIWLIFRGITQISRGIFLKEANFPGWGWSVFGGVLVVIFGFMMINHPFFGAISIVIWTSLSLIVLGIFTIIFSFVIKRIEDYL